MSRHDFIEFNLFNAIPLQVRPLLRPLITLFVNSSLPSGTILVQAN
jgi:hypothetical protein